MCDKLEKELFKIRMLLRNNDMYGILAVMAGKPATAQNYKTALDIFEDKFPPVFWIHLQRIIRYALILEGQKA